MEQARCKACKEPLSYPGSEMTVLLPNGNEESLRLCRCGGCGKVYLDGFEEEFMGGCQPWLHGPFSEEDGRRLAEEMKRCPKPADKHCPCAAHKAVFDLVCRR